MQVTTEDLENRQLALRIEVDQEGIELLMRDGNRERVVERLRSLGYLYVTLDLAGFRSGSMNEGLARGKRARDT